MVPELGMLEATSLTSLPFNEYLQANLFVQFNFELLILPASWQQKPSTDLCIKKCVILNQIHTSLIECPSPLLLQDLGNNRFVLTLSVTFLSS